MKKINLLRFAAILSIFALSFTSCTKDSLSKTSDPASKNHSNNLTNDPIPGSGSVQAILNSATALRLSLVAFESDGTTSQETFADQNGFVEIDGLQEGTYTIVAHAYVPAQDDNAATDVADITIKIPGVKILSGQIVDLGTITFGQ